MNVPRWWSQPFPPEGGQTAEGIKRQLGRPDLAEYAVLIREAAQNSWDARICDQVDFRIRVSRLGNRALNWRRLLVTSGSGGDSLGQLDKLHSDSWVLTVSDRGTSGLGGPIRADERQTAGITADFVQFIRNVGEPRDKRLGGGTYGFGKGIFYRVSQVGVIVVDTLNDQADQRSRRLMGAALGEVETTPDGRRLTGRHWWGEVNGNIPDPVLGDHAAQIAEQLGLPGFADGRTGTDVTIVLPSFDLDDLDGGPEMLAERLRGYIYWYLWPKMVPVNGRSGMHFQVEVDGQELEFPDIGDLPVLGDFAKSLTAVRAGDGEPFTMKTHVRQYGTLGGLSLEFTFANALDNSPIWNSIRAVAPIEPPYRHVARMRQAELVVDYFEGELMPNPEVGYTGSFVVSKNVDEFFAQAEPPTHDSWEIGALTGAARGIVQRSRSFLTDECRKQVEARSGGRSKAVRGLGRLASSLGSLVRGAAGTRPTESGKAKTSGGRSALSKGRIRTLRESHIIIDDGRPYVEYIIEVPDSISADAVLTANTSVLVAGGRRETPEDAPAGTDYSAIVGWYRSEDSESHVVGPVLDGADLWPGIWKVRAHVLEDVSVEISVAQGG